MTEEPLPIAAAYTIVQPSGGPYKASSLGEGFICAGIWAVLAASAAILPRLQILSLAKTLRGFEIKSLQPIVAALFHVTSVLCSKS